MKKVLLIDDNPQNNRGYIDSLRLKYCVDVTIKLVSAERMLDNETFDAVIIDVMMPTQFLDTNDEMTTGFEYYEQCLKARKIDSKIVFWSRLVKSCYDEFFETPPKGTFFVHKDDDDEHLAKFMDKLYNVKNSK